MHWLHREWQAQLLLLVVVLVVPLLQVLKALVRNLSMPTVRQPHVSARQQTCQLPT